MGYFVGLCVRCPNHTELCSGKDGRMAVPELERYLNKKRQTWTEVSFGEQLASLDSRFITHQCVRALQEDTGVHPKKVWFILPKRAVIHQGILEICPPKMVGFQHHFNRVERNDGLLNLMFHYWMRFAHRWFDFRNPWTFRMGRMAVIKWLCQKNPGQDP